MRCKLSGEIQHIIEILNGNQCVLFLRKVKTSGPCMENGGGKLQNIFLRRIEICLIFVLFIS